MVEYSTRPVRTLESVLHRTVSSHCNPRSYAHRNRGRGAIEFATMPTLIKIVLNALSCQVPKLPSPAPHTVHKGQKGCIPRTRKKERLDYNVYVPMTAAIVY